MEIDPADGGGDDAEEPEATGWSDDDDDSWGNDEDDGFTNDLGDAADRKEDEDEEYDLAELEQLDTLNQHLDDDGDSSWKVRRAAIKCISAMIGVVEDTARDFNPNMHRLVVQQAVRELVVLLARRCSERVSRIQLSVFAALRALLVHLNRVQEDPARHLTVGDDVVQTVCALIARKEYIAEVLQNNGPSQPAVHRSFFDSVASICTLHRLSESMATADRRGKSIEFIPMVLPLCVSTMTQYKVCCAFPENSDVV